MSTAIGRDHVVNLVIGNQYPFAIHFDFVVVTKHATLGRAAIHQVAARALAIVSFELRVEVLMPFIVTYPIISVLRCRVCKKKHGEPTSKQRREVLPFTWKLHLQNSLNQQAPFHRAERASCELLVPAVAASQSRDKRSVPEDFASTATSITWNT